MAPLQPFAGIGVANARHEEAEAEGQHDDIPHEKLLAARAYLAQPLRVSGKADYATSIRTESGPDRTRVSDREVPPGA